MSTRSEINVLDMSIEKKTTPDAIPIFPSAERRPNPNIVTGMCSVTDPGWDSLLQIGCIHSWHAITYNNDKRVRHTFQFTVHSSKNKRYYLNWDSGEQKLLPQTKTCDGRYDDDNMKNTVVVSY